MVGVANGLFVMLDDDQRVAAVAQGTQGVEQQVVVARVQADRRLVEDVAHAPQVGAELGRQPDALGLAARQGRCRPVERQVVETDLAQEGQAGTDLRDQVASDVAFAPVQFEGGKEPGDVCHRSCSQLVDAKVAEAHGAGHRVEAGAVAGRTTFVRELFGLAEHERVRVVHLAAGLLAGAVARGAPAVLGVVREQAWIRLGKAGPAGRARAPGRKGDRLRTEPSDRQHLEDALAVLEGECQLRPQLRFVRRPDRHHADREFDVVFLVAVDARPLARRQILAVHPQLLEALAACPLGKLGIEALAVDHLRRQQLDRLAVEVGLDLGRDRLEALRPDRHVAFGTVLGSELDVEQAQEGLDLGQRRDRTLAPAA